MGIGAYRHLVTLTHPTAVIDPPGWWCSLQNSGAQVMEGQVAYVLRGRYHPGLRLETRIAFEDRTLQVQSVADTDERHTELTVMAVEVVGRGRHLED